MTANSATDVLLIAAVVVWILARQGPDRAGQASVMVFAPLMLAWPGIQSMPPAADRPSLALA